MKIKLDRFDIAAIIVFALLWALVIVFALQDLDKKIVCHDNGGYVEEYDCGVFICGDGCVTEICEWRCVSASAESN